MRQEEHAGSMGEGIGHDQVCELWIRTDIVNVMNEANRRVEPEPKQATTTPAEDA